MIPGSPLNRFWNSDPSFYEKVKTTPLQNPFLVIYSTSLANQLGIASKTMKSDSFLKLLNGEITLGGVDSIASVYAGHQFGGWVPQLGDGRAHLIGDLMCEDGVGWEFQLKGLGKTPFSRFGDGRAVLRSSIREFLCSEAMHALGVPTTRALGVIGSETPVQRECIEPGAAVLRMSPSFIRFGHFEYFSNRNPKSFQKLIDFVITTYFSECLESDNPEWAFLNAVADKTALLIAKWQSLGFCHGVMNTDNMSILGLTLDYGPFGFLEEFEFDYICNHSDEWGRYSYAAQPEIAGWNLQVLAQAILTDRQSRNSHISALVETYFKAFNRYYFQELAFKLGLTIAVSKTNDFLNCLKLLFEWMQKAKPDYTYFWTWLGGVSIEERYPESPFALPDQFYEWLNLYREVLTEYHISDDQRRAVMQKANPKFVLKNYIAQEAIDAALNGDFETVQIMYELFKNPYQIPIGFEYWMAPTPEGKKSLIVSCSS